MGIPSASIHEPAAPSPASQPPAPGNLGQRLIALLRRRRRLLVVLATLLVLYTAFGFLLLPWTVRRQLEKRLTAALHRETTIARVCLRAHRVGRPSCPASKGIPPSTDGLWVGHDTVVPVAQEALPHPEHLPS